MTSKFVTVAIAAATGLAFAGAASADQSNVGGTYQIQGQNINGSPYGGTAKITVTSDNTCRIVWTTGGTKSSGICMRSGNVFTAGYVLQGKVGLVIYEIEDDGAMNGVWTVADTTGVGKERLIPVR